MAAVFRPGQGEEALPASQWLARRRTPAPLAQAGTASRKICHTLHAAAGGVSGKALLFGYFLLGPQEKVTRAPVRKLWPADAAPLRAASTRFRLAAGHFSLLAQRKVTKRNGLPRQDSTTGEGHRRSFPIRHSMAQSENGGHPWPPPSGSPIDEKAKAKRHPRAQLEIRVGRRPGNRSAPGPGFLPAAAGVPAPRRRAHQPGVASKT
jgi:hypothetical protein